jgi:hypothetical protein
MRNLFVHIPNSRVFTIADDMRFGVTELAPGFYEHPENPGNCAYVCVDRASLLRAIS